MHIARLGLRPLLVLVAALAAVLFVVINFGSPSHRQANAGGPAFNPAGVVCVNVDLDLPPGGTIEQPNAVELLIRFDHQKNDPSGTRFDLAQSAVIGGAGVIPDHAVGVCTATNAGGSPNTLATYAPTQHPSVDPFKRPDLFPYGKAIVVTDAGVVTTCADGGVASPCIAWTSCAFESGLGGWLYSTFAFPVAGVDFGAVTTGKQQTWLSTSKCTTDTDGNGTADTPTYVGPARATQRAIENKTTGVVTASAFAGNGLDWDADTCTDWLELSPSKLERTGTDPFVGGDCAGTGANTGGNLSGVVDAQDCDATCTATGVLYHCMARQDHDATNNYVSISGNCYDNVGALSGATGLPQTAPAGEGPAGDSNASGPPPPPPYTNGPPVLTGNGKYCPAGPNCTTAGYPDDPEVGTQCGESGLATGATTGPPGTLTRTGAGWIVNQWIGATVTAGGKTITVASNNAATITGTAGWSGGGNPGAVAYIIVDNADSDGDGVINDGCPGGPAAAGGMPGESLVVAACVTNAGATAAPNYVVLIHDGDNFDKVANAGTGGPKTDIAALKFDEVRVQLYINQSNGECSQKQPSGAETLEFNVRNTQTGPAANALCAAGPCVVAPWRQAAITAHGASAITDFDQDGCTDSQELGQPNPNGKCGDDPFNPLDVVGTPNCSGPQSCLAGTYDLVAQAKKEDCQRTAATTLTANINAAATSIPIADATSYLTAGAVLIGTETIGYTGKTPGVFPAATLTGATRGVFGAVGALPPNGNEAASHSSGDAVIGAPKCQTIAGYYYNCIADIQQAASTTTLDAQALCYIDSPAFTNNRPANGGASTCAPVTQPALMFCGDGVPGSPMPGCSQDKQIPPVACTKLPTAGTPFGIPDTSRHDCGGRGTGNTSPVVPVAPCDVTQWQLAHVDKSAHLVGSVNTTTNSLDLYGCFEDPNNVQPLSAVYIEKTDIDAHSGNGFLTFWSFQTNAACKAAAIAHSPAGLTAIGGVTPLTLPITIVKQPPAGKPVAVTSTLSANVAMGDTTIPLVDASAFPTAGGGGRALIGSEFISYAAKSGNSLTSVTRGLYGTTAVAHSSGDTVTLILRGADTTGPCTPTTCRDSDSDGCYDKDELQSQVGTQTAADAAKAAGGMRDPQNPFDFPDITTLNLHSIDVADIVYVVNRFRHDMNNRPVPVNPYDAKADHTTIPGNNAGETWHLGVPNGQIDVGDIVNEVNSFNHKCK